MTHAFITWDTALGRRMCPLATFGARAPLIHRARLVCVDPPRADRASLANADDMRGAIVLVVRGGCSFLEKAQRIQQAGAVAMILANNTREEPFGMFTMAADATDTDAVILERRETIRIPCVMMCLYDVHQLFKQYPPSVQTGVLTLEIHAAAREHELVAECEAARLLAMQGHTSDSNTSRDDSSSGWGAALKRKTSSLIKRWEAPAPSESSLASSSAETSTDDAKSILPTAAPASALISDGTAPTIATNAAIDPTPTLTPTMKQPVFAFVQWAINASEYVLFFAPLSDFCLVANQSVYEGRRVVCDPLLAHEDVIRNGAALADAIAVVQRGACTFPAKLERIQRCGAAAAIVGNDDAEHDDAAFVMSVDHIKVDHVTIPAVMVSHRVFQRLVEVDRPAHLRILCFSGEAAAECLARAGGQPIPIREIQTPDQVSDPNDALTRLHVACRTGDHGACQRVLDETCEDDRARRDLVLARDQFQLTALHHACAADAAKHASADHIVALLLRLGAQANARDAALNAPLHLACLRGHAACVKRILTASIHSQALASAQNLGGATPIHYAAMAGSTACVELLLSVNARRVAGDQYAFDGVDAQDEDGATPLHVACAHTHVDCVLYLVAANANLSVHDRHGRTALQIACALVNEPVQSLHALLIVEKLMDAGAPVVVDDRHEADPVTITTSNHKAPLVIDIVASKAIKRELEIAFLRREAQQSRTTFRGLTQQLETQNIHLESLQHALRAIEQRHAHAQGIATERERRIVRQQRQIEQLQLQMKTLLTVLHSGQPPDGAAGLATHVLADAATATSVADDAHETETETARAQDAALARDLGKKCCRERQFALAQTYFERSLEVFPLPGVARLLDQTKAMRCAAEARLLPRPQERTGLTNEDDGQRLRCAVAELTAAQPTKDALMREIEKLEATDRRTSDYGASRKWIEWLLALPWDAKSDDAAPHKLLVLEATMFDEIERMENERLGRRQHEAARVIQQTFRERYALHLLRRLMASAQIQRVYKRHRQRREQQRHAALAITRHRQRAKGEATVVQLETTTLCDEEESETKEVDREKEEAEEVDVTTTVDPRGQRNCMRVVRGERLESAGQYAVLQLLTTSPVARRSLASHKNEPTDVPLFYVWKRWGVTREYAKQSTMAGPYEDLETATVRYERLLRESQSADTQHAREVGTRKEQALQAASASVPTAWTWLRASAS